MTTLVIATRNKHKVTEIQSILGDDFQCLTLNEFPGAPEVIEDGASFSANAEKKARSLAEWLESERRIDGETEFVLADDSGLEVDALNNAPGVHSARYAALISGNSGNSSDADNNARLLRELANVEDGKRTGRFRCVLALVSCADLSRATRFFEGVCEGHIEREPHGAAGFGYDPLFIPDGYAQSFAELGEEVKNGMSHRARALEGLKSFFNRG